MKKEARRVEVTIVKNGVSIRRAFTNVKDVGENANSYYVLHYDDNGDELQAMFSRSNVASIDWYTEAECKRITKGEVKTDLSSLISYLEGHAPTECLVERKDPILGAIELLEKQRKNITRLSDDLIKSHNKIKEYENLNKEKKGDSCGEV